MELHRLNAMEFVRRYFVRRFEMAKAKKKNAPVEQKRTSRKTYKKYKPVLERMQEESQNYMILRRNADDLRETWEKDNLPCKLLHPLRTGDQNGKSK